ncbi:MAG: 50S ribosomal protein L19e [Desulfurococcaceae archaeon]|jgi:large subunit ribosomal protein L19e|nr:50S ribosomal protein L19e [Desulfurococcaceae archaeon]
MDLSLQRRLAAEILGVGENNIRFDPERLEDISKAFRREEIKALIEDGAIYAIKPSRNSRGRINMLREKKRRGRRRGSGSRKGSRKTRSDEETMWVYRIRRIRRYLKYLKDHEIIDTRTFRRLYRMAKGGYFRSLSALKMYMEAEGILKRE